MSRLAPFVLLSLSIVVTLARASSPQVTWHRLTDTEAGFSISFPGKPAYSQSTSPETGQPLETYSFYYNGNTLHVSFGPLVPAPRTALEVSRVLSDTADVYARNAGTLLRQEKLPGGGRQFDNNITTPSGTMQMRSRVYIHRGMMFTLLCSTYAKDGVDEWLAERFFSSFSFADVSQGRKVTARMKVPKKSPQKVPVNSQWHALRGPDGDFMAAFPGKPDYGVDTSSGTALHHYRFAHGENFFSVSYRERYEPTASPEQELKQALKNYHAALSGWEPLRQVEMPEGYMIEHRGVSTSYPILARTRLYLRGPRLYYVTVMTKSLSGPNKDDVIRFFSSFRLL